MTVTPHVEVEFPRPLAIDRLAPGAVVEDLVANADECAALAERFGLVALDGLSGRVSVRRPADGPLVRVEGRVVAEVVQSCVITLEPVRRRVEESFVQLFTLKPGAGEREVVISPEDEDAPEPLTGDSLDLGEVLAEQLALALEPYPRAPGAVFEGASYGGRAGGGSEEDNPFAVLHRLKRRH